MRELVGFWASLLVLVAVTACCGTPDKDPCDINGDGKSNDLDFVEFQSLFGSSEGDANWNPRADLDGDGVILGSDFVIFKTKCGGE